MLLCLEWLAPLHKFGLLTNRVELYDAQDEGADEKLKSDS